MSPRARLRRLAPLAAVAALLLAPPASAATKVVTFDDQAPGTRVAEQYRDSHGVSFVSGFGALQPYVEAVGAIAHSGDRAGIYSCVGLPGCGEGFSNPHFRGQLKTSATSVSAYVGYRMNHGEGDTARVRILAYEAGGALVAQSGYVTVAENAPFSQQVVATAPAGRFIDYFDVLADAGDDAGNPVGIDDVAITTPDAAPPPNFTLNEGQNVVELLSGTSAEVPVDLNRINGSNGDITFGVDGLPPGVTASFAPNPVPGAETRTTLTLTAAENAPHMNDYRTITVTATPTSPGAGPAPRSITKQIRVRENCDRVVRFDYVDARSDECMRKHGGWWEAREVRINGLLVRAAEGSPSRTLRIDMEKQRIEGLIDAARFDVLLDGPGDEDVSLYTGPIAWDFSKGDDGPRKVSGFKFTDSRTINWLRIAALEATFQRSGRTVLTPSLRFTYWPFNYFGSITAAASFTADNDRGPDFSGLELSVGDVNALGIQLKNVRLRWQQGGTWVGEAKVVLRFGKPYAVDASFGLRNGQFDFLRGNVSGLNVALSPGVFLQRIGFEVQRDPLTLAGTIGLSAGPKVGDVSAITANGTLRARLADPFVVEVTGNAKVADRFELGSALLRYSSTGLFEFGAKAKFDLWRLSLDGGVEGWVDGTTAFNVEGAVKACLEVFGVNPCGDAKVLLSSRGVAGCIGVYGYYVGAGATWDLDFDAFTGCDLGPFRAVKPAGGLSAAARLTRTTLPKGLPSVAWEVRGDGSVPGPGVTLTGPRGQGITVSRDVPFVQQGGLRAELRDDGTTFVLADRPAAGTWTLSDDGSVPVARVREARGLPRPSVSARVSGRGRTRTLSWKLRPIPGQRVTFAEVGRDVRNAVATTKAPRGSVRFKPADGPGGRRAIVALVEQGGRPRTTLTAGSYRAPRPPKPGIPLRLRAKRSGSRLVVSWRPNPAGFRHAVYVALGNGSRSVRIVDARRRSLTLRGIPSSAGAKITVVGLTAANGKGRAARASVKPLR